MLRLADTGLTPVLMPSLCWLADAVALGSSALIPDSECADTKDSPCSPVPNSAASGESAASVPLCAVAFPPAAAVVAAASVAVATDNTAAAFTAAAVLSAAAAAFTAAAVLTTAAAAFTAAAVTVAAAATAAAFTAAAVSPDAAVAAATAAFTAAAGSAGTSCSLTSSEATSWSHVWQNRCTSSVTAVTSDGFTAAGLFCRIASRNAQLTAAGPAAAAAAAAAAACRPASAARPLLMRKHPQEGVRLHGTSPRMHAVLQQHGAVDSPEWSSWRAAVSRLATLQPTPIDSVQCCRCCCWTPELLGPPTHFSAALLANAMS